MATLFSYSMPQSQMIPSHSITPQFTHTEWLHGWRRWAESRKRGKMAQFIIDLLEKGISGRWLDISIGKFELTEWHSIAQFWYKKKKRASDSQDAPCMLRKGLPRAFPGLEEVKTESIKDGTQYKSRVFQCRAELVQEVLQIMSGQGTFPLMVNPLVNEGEELSDDDEELTSGWPETDDPLANILEMNGYNPGIYPQQQQNALLPATDGFDQTQIKREYHQWGSQSSPYMEPSPQSYGASPTHSPQYNSDHLNGHVMLPADQQWTQQEPTGYTNQGGLYNHLEQPAYLDVPVTPLSSDKRRSSLERSANLHNSFPNSPQRSSPQMMVQTSMGPVEPMLMPMKLLPNKSPLEGGGDLAVVFTQALPEGPKALVYISQDKSNCIQVEVMQENAMTLSAIVPQYHRAEEVDVNIYCNSQLIAHAPFTFFQGANYDAAQILRYVHQYMPQLFPGGLGMGGSAGQGSQGDGFIGGGNYNFGNPAYMLLIGACRNGIEPLVRALLQIPGVGPLLGSPIPGHGGLDVAGVARQNGHTAIANCITDLIKHSVVTARLPSGVDPITKLERGGSTAEDSAKCVFHALKAVRDGEDPTTAIKNFVTQNKKSTKDSNKEQEDLAKRLTKIVITDGEKMTPAKSAEEDTAVNSASEEIEALKEENRQLREEFETIQDEHKAKVRECQSLLQERVKMDKKIMELEGELEETKELADKLYSNPQDHGKLYRAQSDMTMLSRGVTTKMTIKPRLTRQNRSIDPGKNPPLAFMQTWQSKESGISVSMEDEISACGRRRSSILSMMSEKLEGNEITLLYPSDEAKTVADSLYFETVHMISEDWPLGDSEKVFKAGERLVMIDGQSLRDKTFDEVLELLKQINPDEERKQIVKQTMPSYLSSKESEMDLDASRIDALLTQTPPSPRTITLTQTAEGLPFSVAGGNAVGLFIMDVQTAGVVPGDQIIQINGESTANMTYEEAVVKLNSATQLNLEVLHNKQGWESQRLQQRFELDSAVYKCQASYSPDKEKTASPSKEMELTPGTMVHVINTSLYGETGHWLAWKLSPDGHKVALKKIPNASRAKELYGDAGKLYQRVNIPVYSH